MRQLGQWGKLWFWNLTFCNLNHNSSSGPSGPWSGHSWWATPGANWLQHCAGLWLVSYFLTESSSLFFPNASIFINLSFHSILIIAYGFHFKSLGFQNTHAYCLEIHYEVMSLKVVRKYFVDTYENEFLEVFMKTSWGINVKKFWPDRQDPFIQGLNGEAF